MTIQYYIQYVHTGSELWRTVLMSAILIKICGTRPVGSSSPKKGKLCLLLVAEGPPVPFSGLFWFTLTLTISDRNAKSKAGAFLCVEICRKSAMSLWRWLHIVSAYSCGLPALLRSSSKQTTIETRGLNSAHGLFAVRPHNSCMCIPRSSESSAYN